MIVKMVSKKNLKDEKDKRLGSKKIELWRVLKN